MNLNFLIIPSSILLIIILMLILLRLLIREKRRKKAFREEIQNRKYIEKVKQINQLLKPYGYFYNTVWDCLSTRVDAWQKEFGYCSLYDEMAPYFNIIFDCEPIYFEYNHKLWLIEFWKGQYGIAAGAEIGIYCRNKLPLDSIYEKTVYTAVSGRESLPVGMTIWHKDTILFEQKKRHWWLASFMVGEFAEPQDLRGEIEITFPTQEMCMAFLKGIQQAGYEGKQIYIKGYTVFVTFDIPYTKQPKEKKKSVVKHKQKSNYKNCKMYNYITKDYDNTLDKILFLTMEYPLLFDALMKIGKTRELFKILE